MIAALRLAAVVLLVPAVASAQMDPSVSTALLCTVSESTDYAAAKGRWTETPGDAASAFELRPILAPETCDAMGCTSYVSGWVMLPEDAAAGASTCWSGMTPDAVICDLMGMGQALINLSARTAMVMRYEGFTYGLPDSRVSVSLATCTDR